MGGIGCLFSKVFCGGHAVLDQITEETQNELESDGSSKSVKPPPQKAKRARKKLTKARPGNMVPVPPPSPELNNDVAELPATPFNNHFARSIYELDTGAIPGRSSSIQHAIRIEPAVTNGDLVIARDERPQFEVDSDGIERPIMYATFTDFEIPLLVPARRPRFGRPPSFF